MSRTRLWYPRTAFRLRCRRTSRLLSPNSSLPLQALVEMDGGLMLVKTISDGSSLAVLAAPECDTDLVSYEVTLLVEAVGEVLTPAVRVHQGY
jgi:hypothetical protein